MDSRFVFDYGVDSPGVPVPWSSNMFSTTEASSRPESIRHRADYYTQRSALPTASPSSISAIAPASVWTPPALSVDPKATLLTRACLSLTFGRGPAEIYLSHLLGGPSQSDWNISYGSGEHVGAYRVALGTITRTVDHDVSAIRGEGSLVPQTLWRPSSELDHIRLVLNARLELPIWFDLVAGGIGISVADAVDGNRAGLRDKDSHVSMKGRATAAIRFLMRGNVDVEKNVKQAQIHIRDDTVAKAPITRARLVRLVGQQVEKFAKDLGIIRTPSDRHLLLILGLVQVSAGCWQPLLFQVAPPRQEVSHHFVHSSPVAAYPV